MNQLDTSSKGPSYGSRRLRRWARYQHREEIGLPHPPRKLSKKARRVQRQEEAQHRREVTEAYLASLSEQAQVKTLNRKTVRRKRRKLSTPPQG